jgi:hypothetical protein
LFSEEIIDTIGNLYIDLVSSETGKTSKEVIIELLGEDDKLIRQAWDSDEEEMGVEIDEYVARQKAIEVLRNKNKQTQQQKLANPKTKKKTKKVNKVSKFAESILLCTSFSEALDLVTEELKVVSYLILSHSILASEKRAKKSFCLKNTDRE